MDDIYENIVNMLKCRRGEHPLFRSFGLGGEVDSVTGWGFGVVQVEIKKYYPDVDLKSMSVSSSPNGEYKYTIEVRR